MTRDEVKTIIKAISTYYDTFEVSSEKVDAWHLILADYEYENVIASLKAYVTSNTSQFAPSIGQLVNGIYDIQHANDMTAEEAWTMAYKAIQNSGYNSREEFDKLPKAVQRTVGSPENLKELALKEDFEYQVEKSVFIRGYRSAVEMEKQNALIPGDVKRLIGSTTQALEDKQNNTERKYPPDAPQEPHKQF